MQMTLREKQNVCLGGFKDNVDLLLNAIQYLEKDNGGKA